MKRKNKFNAGFKLFLFCLVILIHSSANFAFAQLFKGPISSGLGGAGVASTEVAETSFLNPATLAHAPTFVAGIFYQDGWLEGVMHDTELAINLVDNSEGVIFPGALGFVQKRTTYPGADPVDKRIWQLALGNFVVPMFSAGLSFNFMEYEASGDSYTQFNMTAGILWNPHPDWGFGLVVYHLLPRDEEIPLYFRDLQQATAGITYIASEFLRLRLDVSKTLEMNPQKKLQVKGGMETFITKFFVLRLGWRNDQLNKNDSLTLGFSFVGPRFSIDYAYQKSQEEQEKGALHSVDFRIPF
ncbi:MAG: hypothetical protein KDD40_08365 [Bdellovibrionales bacterium]|nr:hypothetical protein [Bdellovibrionales bacterium]